MPSLESMSEADIEKEVAKLDSIVNSMKGSQAEVKKEEPPAKEPVVAKKAAAEEDVEHNVAEPPQSVTEEVDLSSIPAADRKYAKGFNPNGSKTLEQYIHDGKFIEKINNLDAERQELKSVLNEMKNHMKKQQELGYKQAMSELMAERKQAIEMGDVDSVDAIETQIQRFKAEELPPEPKQLHPEAQKFLTKYQHLINDTSPEAQTIKQFVDTHDNRLGSAGYDPAEHMEILESIMLKKFPDYFHKPSSTEREVVPLVESSSQVRGAPKKRKFGLNDLNSEQREVWKAFEKLNVMTVEDYINDLVKLGELK